MTPDQKKRMGLDYGRSILTERELEEIRSLPADTPYREIAERYGISISTIGQIWRNRKV